MKAKVKTNNPAFKLKVGDIIEVENFGISELHEGQKKYRVLGKSFWLPAEDLEILK